MIATYYFVAGEQVITRSGSSPLEAWLSLENYSRRFPVAAEFRNMAIECYNVDGELVASRDWDHWHAALMHDTYGDGWREIVSHAESLG